MAQTNTTQNGGGWRSWTMTTRIVIGIGIPSGIALFLLGLHLDAIDWWTGHDYLLNVFSGLTGACIGVPFALVGLDYLNRKQTEFREAETARTRMASEVDAFVTSFLEPFTSPDLDSLSAMLDHLIGEFTAQIGWMKHGESGYEEAVVAFLAEFDQLIPADRGRPHRRFGSMGDNSREIALIRSWETTVNTRWGRVTDTAHALSYNWIDMPTENAGHQAIKDLLGEGRNPWRSGTRPEERGPMQMKYFLNDVKALCNVAQDMTAHTV
ncbi:hypothetical protein [Streptomyces sp. NPDC051572]|uniref:hypothetical protein n=1 Tax=Streptomyces sp. NPDC051572 TaxID=3155802 RepID=UPI00344DA9B5